MNRISTTYRAQTGAWGNRSLARPFPLSPVASQARGWDVAVRDAVALVPSGIFLGMVLLAAVAICITVNLRGRAQVQTAAMQFNQVASELEAIRKSNTELELQVRRITNEPSLIESAARTRLGMVKPTDIVVPIQSQASTNLASLSFVR